MKQIFVSNIAVVICLLLHSSAFAQGTWTQLKNPIPLGSAGTSILMSDGTVLVTPGDTDTTTWAKLSPDANGDYVNGTWSAVASMNISRLYFASCLLPNGKLFVLGGEYSGDGGLSNTGEIYDPVANTWTFINSFPEPNFGDDPIQLLSTGKILCGSIFYPYTYLYDPLTNLWTKTGTKLLGERSDEETWCKLPDGSVLSYDIFSSLATNNSTAQRYVPATGKWTATGTVPVQLSSVKSGYELGPMMLLPNGNVIVLGTTSLTALYNPSTNKWTQGPSMPTKYGCDDAPAAMLPNGHLLFLADIVQFTAPTKVLDYDPSTNLITDVTPTSPSSLATDLAQNPAFIYGMLMLPNGHMLMTSANGLTWDYRPVGSPNSSWLPTITSISNVSGTTYKLTGTQINGISEGSSYGDDRANSTNYPIVRLKDSKGGIRYARTLNWSPGLVASGSLLTSCQFTLPTNLPDGTYQVSVVANGMSSATQSLTTGKVTTPSNVTAVYTAATKTLVLTGDANGNSLSVTYQAGQLIVQGANGTLINNGTSFQTAFTGQLNLSANLAAGDDSISLLGIPATNVTIMPGTGNDKIAVLLSNITNLTVTGGATTDVITTTSSKIGTYIRN